VLAGCLGGDEDEVVEFPFNGEKPIGSVQAEDFTLVDQNGDNWTLSNAEGNVTIIAFIFSRCPDVCIVVSMNINIVLDQLEPEDREVVQVVSVTVDPWSDTPAAMLEFATARSADWPHLTSPDAGDIEHEYTDMEEIWRNYQLSLSMVETHDEREYLIEHALPTFILDRNLDKRVVWLGSDWDPAQFGQDLQQLIDE
jgi:protein SCO1/2